MSTAAPFTIKCDRYELCQKELEVLRTEVRRLEDQKRDDDRMVGDTLKDISTTVAEIKGRMAGYLLAGGVLGAAVATIAQKVLH